MVNTRTSTARKNGVQDNDDEKKSSILHNATLGEQPTSDAGYLELLGFAMFSTAIGNQQAVEENWPEILYGFKSFHVQRVAEFNDADLRDVGQRVPILRDKPQLSALVAGAAAILQISQVYGSFKQYLRSFEKDGPTELLKDISERFTLVDSNVFREFLKSAGAKVKFPDAGQSRKSGKPVRSSRRGNRPGNQRRPKAGGGPAGSGKPKPVRGGKPGPAKSDRPENGQDDGRSKSRRSRRRRFGFRKKKAAGNSTKPEKSTSGAKG